MKYPRRRRNRQSTNHVRDIDFKTLLNNIRWALKRIWSINASLLLGSIFLTILSSFFPAAMALVTRTMINIVVETLGKSGEFRVIIPWLGLGCGLTILQSLSTAFNQYISLRLGDEVNFHITSDIMSHASTLDVAFFEQPQFQDMMRRVEQNTAQRLSSLVNNTLTVIMNSIQLFSLLAILLMIEPLLGIAILPLAIPYFIFHLRLSRTRYQIRYNRSVKNRWTRYFVSLVTNYQWVPEVKLFDLAPYFIERFQKFIREFKDQDRQLHLKNLLGNSTFITISNLVFYTTFARVIFRALSENLTVGDVAIYGGTSLRLRSLLDSIIRTVSTIYEHALYVRDFREFLKLSPSIDVHKGLKPSSLRGEVELKNVTFSYPGVENESVLSDVSLHINAGEIVAFVGENGAGKTTLAKLIAGLYVPASGSIVVDGIDIQEWSLHYLRSKFAFVFQNFGQYEATAADNIAYGNWRTLLENRQEVEHIAKTTNVHELIEAMPRGYETNLGRLFSDYRPSGGQWQHLAVARAFARDAVLLILDEPTSNLDARAEYELFCRFRQLAEGRTTIIISHRFSTVSMADRIIMLDEGRVVETGTHEELLKTGGAYAGLYLLHQRQMGETG